MTANHLSATGVDRQNQMKTFRKFDSAVSPAMAAAAADLGLASLSDDALDLVMARCSPQTLCRMAQVSRRLCRRVVASDSIWQRHFLALSPHGSAARGSTASSLVPCTWWRAYRGWLSYNPLACSVIQPPSGGKHSAIFGVALAAAGAVKDDDDGHGHGGGAAGAAHPTRLWAVDGLGRLHEYGLLADGHSLMRSVEALSGAALAVEAAGHEVLVAGSGKQPEHAPVSS
jgi:hypothetical protein